MIAYLVHRFPVRTQTFTYDEVRGLVDARLDLVVYPFRAGEDVDWPLAGISVRVLPQRVSRYAAALVWWALRRPARLARCVWWLLAGAYVERPSARERLANLSALPRGALLAREPGIDLFHAQFANEAATAALVAATLAVVPFSFRSHTAPNPQLLGEKLRRAAAVLSISEYDAARLRAVEPRAQIVVAPLGIPLPEQKPVTRVPGLVVSVGSLIEKKGHDVLVDACARMRDEGRDLRCEIVGDGHLAASLRRQIDALDIGDRVTLRGYLPRGEVEELVSRATVFALASIPSSAGTDGVPVVLLEAMAVGTPCVSSRISGIPEVIRDDQTGVLVPPGDVAALAAALTHVLDDPELAQRLGDAGRAFVRSERTAAACYGRAAEVLAGCARSASTAG